MVKEGNDRELCNGVSLLSVNVREVPVLLSAMTGVSLTLEVAHSDEGYVSGLKGKIGGETVEVVEGEVLKVVAISGVIVQGEEERLILMPVVLTIVVAIDMGQIYSCFLTN